MIPVRIDRYLGTVKNLLIYIYKVYVLKFMKYNVQYNG